MIKKLKEKWKDALATSFVILLWSIMALLSYWTFLDTSPAFISQITQIDATVQRGNVVALYSQVDFLRPCTVIGDRILIEKDTNQELIVGHNETVITKEMVGRSEKEYTIIVYIPMNLTPGDYWIERRSDIVCNPMQNLRPMKFVSQRAPLKITE